MIGAICINRSRGASKPNAGLPIGNNFIFPKPGFEFLRFGFRRPTKNPAETIGGAILNITTGMVSRDFNNSSGVGQPFWSGQPQSCNTA